MNDPRRTDRPAPDALEARVGLALCARLSQGCEALPHDVTERLRFARERAIERARDGRAQAVSRRPASLGWAWRLAAILPGVLLVAGLVLCQFQGDQEQLQATADIDAALLSDELPPTAYTDPGFAEFLKSSGS